MIANPYLMKNILSLLVFLSLISCDDSHENPYPPEKILEIVKDKEGRMLRKVTTGYIAGEDFYLTIETFDSSENITKAYGIKPYGDLFVTTYQYDTNHRLIKKTEYSSSEKHIKSYSGELYSLQDTVANVNSKKILEEVRIRYNDAENKLYKTMIKLSWDSVARKEQYDTFSCTQFIKTKGIE